jgi:hypothetical protein
VARRKQSRQGTAAATEVNHCNKKELPSWFLNLYVNTWQELSEEPPRLVVKSTAETSGDRSRKDISTHDVFQMETSLWEFLHNIVRPEPPGSRSSTRIHFRADAVALRYSRKSPGPAGNAFIECVIKHFARHIGADLITLDEEILRELGYTEKPTVYAHSDMSDSETDPDRSPDA